MIKSHLLVAIRKILRAKTYAIINTLGLALGTCTCIVVWTVVHHEYTFDDFHPDASRIFRVATVEKYLADAPSQLVPAVVPPLPAEVRTSVPGIEVVAPFHVLRDVSLKVVDRNINRTFTNNSVVFTEKDFFAILPYHWLAGNALSALNSPNQIVLTQEEATRYFGNRRVEDFMGMEITIDDVITVSVSGIIEAWKGNTDFPFRAFVSLKSANVSALREALNLDSWKGTPASSQVLLKLAKNTNAETAQAGIQQIFDKNWKAGVVQGVRLQKLAEIHFADSDASLDHLSARSKIMYTMLAIAVFILALAIINYVNLATAQLMTRNKEIGVRKIMGSAKSTLMVQFLAETFMMVFIAVVLGCALADPILLVFNQWVPAGAHLYILDPSTILFLVAIVGVTTLIAGLYPAYSMSTMRIASGLSRTTTESGSGQAWIRKSLVVFQFSVSLIFIIGSILVGRQLNYMIDSDLGFNSDAVIEFSTDDRAHMDRVRSLQTRIESLAGVVAVARQNMPPMGMDRSYTNITFSGEQPIPVASIKADEKFISLYGMTLVAGKNLSGGDTLREILINESLARALGFKTPEEAVGRKAEVWNQEISIAGVVADFHQASFHEAIKPQLIMGIACADMAVKLETNGKSIPDVQAMINNITREWKLVYPEQPFVFRFLDDELRELYTKEQSASWLVKIAAGVTLFISGMGLLGLALFSAEKRTREIGIRKILGATISQIIFLVGKDIMTLLLIALVLAAPFAWYFGETWLQNFAYHTTLSWWIFVLAGCIACVLAGSTVALVAQRAARANPIDSIRTE